MRVGPFALPGTLLLALLAGLLLVPAPVAAQRVSDGFSVSVDGGLGVRALLRQPDGRLLVGGSFNGINGQACAQVCRLTHDGTVDPGFSPPTFNGIVMALAQQADGRVLVAGNFGTVAGQPRARIARLAADGSFDPGFAGPNIDGVVHALALQPDGRILLAGNFVQVDGVPRSGVLRLLPGGALDPTFQDPATDGIVHAMVLQADGRVLLGGGFTTVDGVPRSGLARLLPDGSLDAGFGSATQVIAGNVRALAVLPDGGIAAGGDFVEVTDPARVPELATAPATKGVVMHRYVALFHADGRLDTSFHGSVTAFPTSIHALQALPDGRLYAGGTVETAPAFQSGVLLRLHRSGQVDGSFSASVPLLRTMLLQGDGELLAGGAIDQFIAGGWLSRFNTDGSRDATLEELGTDDQVSTLALQADGKVVFGGWFDNVDGVARGRLARLMPDGSLDPGFVANANGNVYAIAVMPDNRLLVGGTFTSIGGQARGRVALLEQDGTPVSATIASFGFTVMTLARERNGRLLVGGVFADVDGQPRHGAARLLATGALDPSFNDPGINAQVSALVPLPDGRILVGGGFSEIAGVARQGLARLNMDGSLDTSFDAGLDSVVQNVLLQPDGRILIGGSFTSVAGVPRERLARLFPDGTLDPSFEAPVINNHVSALALQADGRLFIAGKFTRVDGAIYQRLARLNADGSLDASWPNVAVSSDVRTMLLQEDGKAVLGGIFQSVTGIPRSKLARLSTAEPAWSMLELDADADRIHFRRGGTAPELLHAPELGWTDGSDGAVLGPMQPATDGWQLDGIPTTPAGVDTTLYLGAAVGGSGSRGRVRASLLYDNPRLFRDGFEPAD